MTGQRVFPVLRILDEQAARAFYADGLGFTVDWEWRHEPHYPIFMQVSRNGLIPSLDDKDSSHRDPRLAR